MGTLLANFQLNWAGRSRVLGGGRENSKMTFFSLLLSTVNMSAHLPHQFSGREKIPLHFGIKILLNGRFPRGTGADLSKKFEKSFYFPIFLICFYFFNLFKHLFSVPVIFLSVLSGLFALNALIFVDIHFWGSFGNPKVAGSSPAWAELFALFCFLR